MGQAHTILVVDDDAHIREIVRFALTRAGFVVHEAVNGADAMVQYDVVSPDLIILDILMPEMDGTDVCRALRKRTNTPIIFLSSRDDEIDRVLGLELGGDDYVTKPFSPRELTARVKAVLRRLVEHTEETNTQTSSLMTHGRLKLDLDQFKAYWDDQEVQLTVTEFGVVKTLLGYPGKVFTRDALMRGAYKDNTIVSDRTIDSHVTRVRRKFEHLGAHPIETVHGLGYKCGDCKN